MQKARPLSKHTDDAHSSNPLQTSHVYIVLHFLPLQVLTCLTLHMHSCTHTHTPQNPVSIPKREAQSRAREEEKTPKNPNRARMQDDGVRCQHSRIQAGRGKIGPGPFPRGTWDELQCPAWALSQIPQEKNIASSHPRGHTIAPTDRI